MDRESAIKILREHEPELKAAGIVHLRLFGSVARNEATSESDVDVLADLDYSKRPTLITVSRIQNQLSDILGAEVHLSLPRGFKEPMRTRVFDEAVLAF